MANSSARQLYGVIGAGSFGTALANILAENGDVLLFTRKQAVYDGMVQTRSNRQQVLHERVSPTLDLEQICQRCTLLFPVTSSSDLREVMRLAAPYLKPYHLLIHGIKGLNVVAPNTANSFHNNPEHEQLAVEDIRTMSQIIYEESSVLRVGCLSGPNLALNLAHHQPAATTIASRFSEVIAQGRNALQSHRFRVYGNSDVFGVELAGAFSKLTSIASGIVGGLGWGENTTAMVLTRALHEIIRLGKALGAEYTTFLGLGGIGDMIAVAFTPKSRNYSVGYRLAKGEPLSDILNDMSEVAEGIQTVKIAKYLANYYHIDTPIINALYAILFQQEALNEYVNRLMQEDFRDDVAFSHPRFGFAQRDETLSATRR